MTVEQMRAAISDAYSSADWRARVSRMKDSQVIATYHRIFTNK